MYKREDDEVRLLQQWALDHYDLWLRILRLEGTLTQEEFLKTGQEFYNLGLHCANFVLISNYWDYAEPIAFQNLQKLIQEIEEESEE